MPLRPSGMLVLCDIFFSVTTASAISAMRCFGNISCRHIRTSHGPCFPRRKEICPGCPSVCDHSSLPGGKASLRCGKARASSLGWHSVYRYRVRQSAAWGWHALWAWMFRKNRSRVPGDRPFRTRVGEWCAQWVVKRAEAVIVRDRESLRRALAWNKNCIQSFDPVFSVFHKQKDNHRSQKLFIVIPRANSPESFLQWVTELYGKRKGEWSGARIISLEPEAPGEKEVCEELKRSLDAELIAPGSPTELEHALADGSFVVTQRYHGAIAALGMDIPFIAVPQSPGDKLAGIGSVHRDEAQKLLKEGEAALRAALRSSFPF